MKKTLYIKDYDQAIWEKAESLAKRLEYDSLSKLVAYLLRKEVKKMEAIEELKKQGFELIELEVGICVGEDHSLSKKISFEGKLLGKIWEELPGYAIYLSKKGKLLIHSFDVDFNGRDNVYESKYKIFDSYTELVEKYKTYDCEDHPAYKELNDLLVSIGNKLGESNVEYLDI